MYNLIEHYAKEGKLLLRTPASLYENLLNFYVAEEDGKVVGVGSIYVYDEKLSEIRSLAVDPAYQGKGIGKKITEQVIADTKELGIKDIISLTYQVEFFEKLGFEVVDKENIPQKVRKDCLNCPKFFACDEIAMVRHVN